MNKGVKRANLFLIELVLDLFIFALCAAVCVGLLVHARSMSRQSGELAQAVYVAQSIAEEWRVTGTAPVWDEDGFRGNASQNDGSLSVTIVKDGREIFTLEGVRRVE